MQSGETEIHATRGREQWHGYPARHGRAGRATGFTLTEIMIALGVLAVGMAMIAGALHAGIQVHIRTIDDIMRQLIGDNALAIVQTRVRHSNTNGITDNFILLGSSNSYFGPYDLKYPWGQAGTPYGAAVLAKCRRIDATNLANDYDVVIVPYTLIPATPGASPGDVNATPFSCMIRNGTTGSSTGSTITGPANTMTTGSVVIDSRNNIVQVCLVKSTPTTTTAEVSETLTATTTNVTLIALTRTVTTDRLECNKPLRARTALSPKPGWTPGSN